MHVAIIRALVCCILFVNSALWSKEWHGIVPLHSRRSEVDRVLGPPIDRSGSLYETKDEKVFIWYSDEPCHKGISELWNVPKDTVLSITLYPKRRMSISDLNLNPAKYKRVHDTHVQDIVYYVDDEEGVKIESNASAGEVELVNSSTYGPSAKDKYLRCPGAAALSGGDVAGSHPRKFDEYSGLSFEDEKARLDNFAIYLQKHVPDYKGYIIVYAGRRSRSSEARRRAKRAKNYLVKQRGIDSGRIVTIYGGRREKVEVELYALPRGISAPTPNPTIDTSAQLARRSNLSKTSWGSIDGPVTIHLAGRLRLRLVR